MKKKYLVTGGTGFIGSALVKKLDQEEHSVRVMDNDSRGSIHRLKGLDLEWIQGDIRDLEKVKAAAQGCDSIVHLAYVNGTEYFYKEPEMVLEIAVKGMMNVLDAALYHGIKELIIASSSEVYQNPGIFPTPENVPLVVPDVYNPRYSYGGGKIITELLAIHYAKFFDRVVIFRPHNVYGPDMGNEHVIPQLIKKMKNKDFTLQGSGKETRSFVYINDFIEAAMKVIEKGENKGIYHIGTQEEIPIYRLAQLVCEQLEITPSPEFQFTQPAKGNTSRRCPDIKKLKDLGFEPKISLKEGLKLTIPWYVK